MDNELAGAELTCVFSIPVIVTQEVVDYISGYNVAYVFCIRSL
jgi:hypothetical protein